MLSALLKRPKDIDLDEAHESSALPQVGERREVFVEVIEALQQRGLVGLGHPREGGAAMAAGGRGRHAAASGIGRTPGAAVRAS